MRIACSSLTEEIIVKLHQ